VESSSQAQFSTAFEHLISDSMPGPMDAFLQAGSWPSQWVPRAPPTPDRTTTKDGRPLSTKPSAIHQRKVRAIKKKRNIFLLPQAVVINLDDSDSEEAKRLSTAKKPKTCANREPVAAFISSGKNKNGQTVGSRLWSPQERHFVVEEMTAYCNSFQGDVKPDESRFYAVVAKKLRAKWPVIFGVGAPGKAAGITRQDVRLIVTAAHKAHEVDKRGRPPALAPFLVSMIVLALSSVVQSKTTLFSLALLQHVALAMIVYKGYGHLLTQEPDRKKGRFVAGREWLRRVLRTNRWTSVRPQGDTRKVPADWKSKCADMKLRLAYFVWMHDVPQELVVNPDHTGVRHHQAKGKMWVTAQQRADKDYSVQNHGQKGQFTCLPATAASGAVLKSQLVFLGKTDGSLPRYNGMQYVLSRKGPNSKGHTSACFKPLFHGVDSENPIPNIGSLCVTNNHWSDNVTSQAWVVDIFIPYYIQVCARLHLVVNVQVAVLILDCWWGWLGAFITWLKDTYPFIKLVYVPAACTPKGQPMDAGTSLTTASHPDVWLPQGSLPRPRAGVVSGTASGPRVTL
jgi:hypothetical protein